jgi:acyl dehydratase
MIDRSHIGYTTSPSTASIDAWRVQLFCKAIGEVDPVYTDLQAARAAGHPACPVPPTYLKAVEGDHFTSADILRLLQVPLKGVLHAEQSFTHHHPVHVGDIVEVSRQIVDIYDKKEGAFTFIVVDSFFRVVTQLAATSRQVILVRNNLGA